MILLVESELGNLLLVMFLVCKNHKIYLVNVYIIKLLEMFYRSLVTFEPVKWEKSCCDFWKYCVVNYFLKSIIVSFFNIIILN